ncbi:hypothetical protein A4G28_06780 [Mycobacterium ostraviense]|uniref:Uncharacterized protein n=1 Tax=Mycobacterium ostraviense TaxID=2738409 RepID=A0A163TNN4_9MYCO|nr:hypothetical protein A4G28_06780 [Mycobacterium ostraviense]
MNVFERLGGQQLARIGSASVLVAPAAFEADDADGAESSQGRSGTRSRIRCRVTAPSRVEHDARNTPERTDNQGGPGQESRAATKRCPTRHPLTH